MDNVLIADIFYYIVLYGTLCIFGIPIVFFLLWSFFGFFRKHIVFFYVMMSGIFLITGGIFYLTHKYWILQYYPVPVSVQIIGLLLLVFSSVIVKVAQGTITFRVRFFYPLLKAEKFKLRTDGVYKYVRHPIYAVFPLFVLGAFFYTGQFILLLVFLFNLASRGWYAEREEEQVKKNAIGDYEAYKKHTPNRFYPWFKPKSGRA